MSAEDELAIQRLVAIYSDGVTCGDAAAAAAVFTEDGVLHAFTGPEVVGRDAIREALGGRQRRSDATGSDAGAATAPSEPGFSMQFTRFVAVDIDGDTAIGRSYYLELSRGPDRDGVGRCSTGINEDRYVRTGEGWRIAHRRLMRTYVGDMAFPGKTTGLEIGAWPGGPSQPSGD
ncbi:MAG: nuclear transport factor 2 family protein [Acidobacteria bacterium]|nr:nuclear transport factor 2 family protein [Acidobacteriota bacterium]